ncbi:MAG: hypothetical protein RIR11_2529 [Bacteroidota bacterium]|jgi:hypothetical protein
MEKIVKIVKIGQDDSNLMYWLSRSSQRLEELEKNRQEVNQQTYHGHQQGFQRVYRVVKRERG